jgi:hypothetical protein
MDKELKRNIIKKSKVRGAFGGSIVGISVCVITTTIISPDTTLFYAFIEYGLPIGIVCGAVAGYIIDIWYFANKFLKYKKLSIETKRLI